MQNEARLLHVTGTVQGVGFRPFIYQLAKFHRLSGHVKNLGNHVEILIEGKKANLESFLNDLPEKKPPLARITNIEINTVSFSGCPEFVIIQSEPGTFENSIIPPDTAICEECRLEIFDPSSRYYHYPFAVCTNCGPRYTTVRALPYDRENTTMADFPLCRECEVEYTDPLNRRHHAQRVMKQLQKLLTFSSRAQFFLSRGSEVFISSAMPERKSPCRSLEGDLGVRSSLSR
jgi:hydrogenase maturation protein HypF